MQDRFSNCRTSEDAERQVQRTRKAGEPWRADFPSPLQRLLCVYKYWFNQAKQLLHASFACEGRKAEGRVKLRKA